jgi:hypothetical protein
VDPSRDGPPRPGHHQSQLNSYPESARSELRSETDSKNPAFAGCCARPSPKFRQFAVLVVA